MRTVEFNQAMSGREGPLRRALPPAPLNLARTVPLPCSARHQKGDISNSLTMGTFLKSFDTIQLSP